MNGARDAAFIFNLALYRDTVFPVELCNDRNSSLGGEMMGVTPTYALTTSGNDDNAIFQAFVAGGDGYIDGHSHVLNKVVFYEDSISEFSGIRKTLLFAGLHDKKTHQITGLSGSSRWTLFPLPEPSQLRR